jgi:hypothetical protein
MRLAINASYKKFYNKYALPLCRLLIAVIKQPTIAYAIVRFYLDETYHKNFENRP